jgi:hypothetical protein
MFRWWSSIGSPLLKGCMTHFIGGHPSGHPYAEGYTTHFIGGHTISLAVTPPVTPLPSQTQKGRRSPPPVTPNRSLHPRSGMYGRSTLGDGQNIRPRIEDVPERRLQVEKDRLVADR